MASEQLSPLKQSRPPCRCGKSVRKRLRNLLPSKVVSALYPFWHMLKLLRICRYQEPGAQFGEDRILRWIISVMRLRGLDYPIDYLDIGGNHPVTRNNTCALYQDGYHGVVVEPNPHLAAKFKKMRPRDCVLPAAVGVTKSENKTAPFYLFGPEANGISTLAKDSADELLRQMPPGSRYETIEIELITINEIIENYFSGKAPFFLSIDCEGYDFQILQSLNFSLYAPIFICAETAEPCFGSKFGKKCPEVAKFMLDKGYSVFADTYVNTIFIRKDIFESLLGNSIHD